MEIMLLLFVFIAEKTNDLLFELCRLYHLLHILRKDKSQFLAIF
mgnify:CR=1 FL=1